MVHVVLPHSIIIQLYTINTYAISVCNNMAGNRRSGGWEHVQLIAIDYHTVAGTAGAECKGDQRLKMARWPESGTDSNSLTETQERGDLEVEQEGQMKAE